AGIGGIIHTMSLQPLYEAVQRHDREWERHADSPGHPEMVRQTAVLENDVRHIEDKVKALDEVLQREMRLLDVAIDNKLENLDEMLQRETRLLLESQKLADVELSRRVQQAETWMVDHDKRVVDTNASQTARLNALEKELDRVREEQAKRSSRVYGG
ncbi:MAG: hypothetical protein VW362_12960, partial [Candidatus Nanopelagicales bacterium]